MNKGNPNVESGSHPVPARQGKSAVVALGVLLTRIAGQPFSLVVSFVSAIYLGPENKGEIAWIIVLTTSVGVLFNFGCGAAVKYEISRGKRNLRESAWMVFGVSMVNGALAAGVISAMFYLDTLGEISSALPWIWKAAVICMIPMIITRNTLFYALMGAGEFKTVNYLELSLSFLVALLTLLFVVILQWGFDGASLAFFLAQLVTFVAVTFVVICRYGERSKFDKQFVYDTYSYGFRSWLGGIPKQFNMSLDSLVVGVVGSNALLGNYSVAVTISRMLLMIPLSITPVLMNRLAKRSRYDALQAAAQVHRVFFFVLILLAVLLGLFTAIVIPILMPAYSQTPLLVAILLVGIVCVGCYNFSGVFFQSQGMPGRTSIAQFVSFFVTVLVTPPAVMMFGAVGAAVACSLTYITTMATQQWMIRRLAEAPGTSFFRLHAGDLNWFRNQMSAVWTSVTPYFRRKVA